MRTLTLALILTLLLVISFVWSLGIGSVPIAPHQVMEAVSGTADPTVSTILWELRLPRLLMAILVGGALGVVGCAFQGLLRNALADPYIVGVSSGSAVGAALGVLLGWSAQGFGVGINLLAFASGLGVLVVILTLSRTNGSLRVGRFLLTGVALSASLWGIVTLLLVLAGEDLSRVIYWLLGGLLNADWQRLEWVCVPILGGMALLFVQARALNLYTAGEETALHLGVPLERMKWMVLVGGSLTISASVAVAGIIGFVGWLVPHLLRQWVGGDYRRLMPLSALGGALLLLWADTFARTLARPVELPVGVITALVGTPLFVWAMRQRRELEAT
ncbi:MAG: iron ABC transporter permease [Fimbriimonadales bacterium]